jgi:cytochrome c biogenesis protein CcmG/thiol:disulfide interchange protein DsbE
VIARFMPVIILLGLTILFGWLLTSPPAERKAITAIKPLPVIDLPALDETAQAWPRNEWFLVNFFASWCVPCAVESPQLDELHRSGLPIIGIAYKDSKVMTRAFLKQYGNPFHFILVDDKGAAAIPFGISGVPESFLVNPQGDIVWHFAGPLLDKQVDEVRNAMR